MGVCSLIHGGHKKVLSYFIQPFYEKEEESTAFLKSKGAIRLAHPRNLSSFTCPPFLSLAPYSLIFLHARSPTSFPFSWAKKIESGTRARARNRKRRGRRKTYRDLCTLRSSMPSFLFLLVSLLLSCPGARVPHRHRRRTTRALPPMLRRKLQGISPPPAPPCARPAPRFSRSNSSPSPPTSAPSSRAHSRV